MTGFWQTNPAALVALVTAAIDVAVAAGAPVSVALKAAVIGLMTVLAGILTRSQVTPNAKVRARLRHPAAGRR